MSGELNRHSLPAVLGANQAFNHYKHSSAPPCTGLRNKAERRGPRHKPCFATLEIARSTGHSTVKLSLVACKSSNGGRVDSPLGLAILDYIFLARDAYRLRVKAFTATAEV